MTGNLHVIIAVLAICQFITLGHLGGTVHPFVVFAHAVSDNNRLEVADNRYKVTGALSITHEANAFLNQATGSLDTESHNIIVEIIAEYTYDPKKGKLAIDRDLVLGHLVIDEISGQHFLKFSKFLILADSRTILYRGQSISSEDLQVVGKIRLNTPLSFETESSVAGDLAHKMRIKVSLDGKVTTLAGKGVGAEVSTEIFPPPSEIEGKSFRILTTANNEEFTVYATSHDAIELLTDNLEGNNQFFVTGRLAIGDGGFNAPWSWHLDPSSTAMTDFSIELCDGVPSEVENNLAYWLFQVETFCPWSSTVIAVNE